MLNLLKKLFSTSLRIAATCGIVALAAYLILNAEQFHRYYLRHEVGTKVVKIVKIVVLNKNLKVAGGGTGFLVNAPSGETYILTNSHICAIGVAGKLLIQLDDGTLVPRNIVKDSETTDLCLVEGLPGRTGIDLADSYSIGEIVAAVGHPLLMPTTVSKGEILGKNDITYILGFINQNITEAQCKFPKNSIIQYDDLKICLVTVEALQTTIVGLPGNSGSPIVNWKGDLVGVLFAGDQMVHWSAVVPLENVRKFLRPY